MLSQAIALVRDARPDLAFDWLKRGGLRDQARTLAAEMAGRMAEKGDSEAAALWLSRSGQHVRAAEVWLSLERPQDALSEWENAGEWNKALALALSIQAPWPRLQSICARGQLPIPDEAKDIQRTWMHQRSQKNTPVQSTARGSASEENPQ